jgi:hypothetical protein
MKRFVIALGTAAMVLMLLSATQGFAAPTTAAVAAATLGPATTGFHDHHGYRGHWDHPYYRPCPPPYYRPGVGVIVAPPAPVYVQPYGSYYAPQSGFYYRGPRLSIGVGF